MSKVEIVKNFFKDNKTPDELIRSINNYNFLQASNYILENNYEIIKDEKKVIIRSDSSENLSKQTVSNKYNSLLDRFFISSTCVTTLKFLNISKNSFLSGM
jgi:hypothetical protein